MAARKNPRVRWNCPVCDGGVLGPGRPRLNNVVRYCLPCSAKAGVLVERVCPAKERAKERKAEATKVKAQRKKERSTVKARKTKRSWIRQDRHIYSGPSGGSFNVYDVAERICMYAGWNKAIPGGSRVACRLWDRTVEGRGSKGYGIRIRRGTKVHISGRGGPRYGVTMTLSPASSRGDLLMTLLHEIVHYVQLSLVSCPTVNGKRRPHDMQFNAIQWKMAKRFWGYDFHPYAAGYSVGRGYAPSRHLQRWLEGEIKAGNPRVVGWIGGGA